METHRSRSSKTRMDAAAGFARPIAKALAIACVVAAAFVCDGVEGPREAEARGGTRAPMARRASWGPALFDQCVRWVSKGSTGIQHTTDFYINLDAHLVLPGSSHTGPMRIWWQEPDKFRQELTLQGARTTKILNADFMWIIDPRGRVSRVHGKEGARRTIAQLKNDRDRLGDLAKFMTLGALKKPGASFTFQGEKKGTGSYAGNWLKVTRRAAGAATMHFWLDYARNQQGQYVVRYPGIVRIDGDRRQRIPTEDYILRDWRDSDPRQPRAFRYPRQIEAYSLRAGGAPARFLQATVRDIKINAGIDPTRFQRPRR